VSYVWNGYGWAIKIEEDTSGEVIDAYNKSESDARFVNAAGDLMTGALNITNSGVLRVYVDANHQFQAYSNAVAGAQQSGIGQGGRVELSNAGVLSGIKTYPAFPSYNLLIANEGPVGFKFVRHGAGSTPTDGVLTTLFHIDGITGNASLGGVTPSIFSIYTAPARVLNIRSDNVPNSLAALDLTGNSTTNFPVGHISFSNQSNTAADKRIGTIGVSRHNNDASGRMEFSLWNAGVLKTQLTILPEGHVGVGTSTPGIVSSVLPTFKNHLTVYNPTDRGYLELASGLDASNSVVGHVGFIADTNTPVVNKQVAGIIGSAVGTAGNRGGILQFYTKIDNGALTERLNIDNAGIVKFYSSKIQINTNSPALIFNKATGADGNQIVGQMNGVDRWHVRLGDFGSESGADAGSEFMIHRYSDAGAYLGTPFQITRSNSTIYLNGSINLNGTVTQYGGSASFTTGGIWCHGGNDTGIVYLGTTGGTYLQNDGATLNLFGKPVRLNSNLTVDGAATVKGFLGADNKASVGFSTGTIAASSGSQALEVKSGGGVGDGAFMAFHRPGSFAANFGIDTDVFWKVGGWSMGGVAHKLFHEGVCPNNSNYFRLTSGVMLVFGTCPVSMGNGWVTFPVAFPNLCIGVVCTGVAALQDGGSITCNSQAFEPSRFFFQPRYVNTGGAVGVATQEYRYIAWGY
jgi:hypothetical protein